MTYAVWRSVLLLTYFQVTPIVAYATKIVKRYWVTMPDNEKNPKVEYLNTKQIQISKPKLPKQKISVPTPTL